MKIGIDYRLANRSCRCMARYCREIVRGLLELDTVNDYLLIVDEKINIDLPVNSNIRFVKIATKNFILGEQFAIPMVLYKECCDVFWSPYNTYPLVVPKQTQLIVTVHDMIFFYPLQRGMKMNQKVGAMYRRLILNYFHKKVAVFFTVSQFSKCEMLKFLNIQAPIEVTYNCVGNMADLVVKKRYELKKCNNYFFTVSGDAPSKNLAVLMNVFGRYFPDQQLLVAGVSENSLLRLQSPDNVIFIRHGIPDEEFITYYLGCKCFLFCSRFEGFGIPIIEAAICGKPIIASRVTSIPEILEDKGWLIDPTESGIRTAIDDFLNGKKMDCDYSSIINRFDDWNKQSKIVKNVCLKIYAE